MNNFKKLDQIRLFDKEKDKCIDYFYSHTDFSRDINIFLADDGTIHEFTTEFLKDKLWFTRYDIF